MLDLTRIKAITLDLDDTLWPVWPTIKRAEAVLADWLARHAPATGAFWAEPVQRHALREHVNQSHPALMHDLSALRREFIRLALERCGDDTRLADPAFEVFYAERNRVTLFDDAQPALAILASRFPLVALSNGNADIGRIGLGRYFKAALSASQFGVGKPDARIFHAAADAAGVPSDAVLHVGDDAALDVLAALDCGMQTIWVNRAGLPWAHDALPHQTVATLAELCGVLAA
ncbi:MAG: HAD family hydrolase [Polaromonas sp.]